MDNILFVLAGASAAGLLFVSATFLRSGVVHLLAHPDTMRDAEAHSPKSPIKVIRGEVDAYKQNKKRDASIAAGMAIDKKTGQFVLQGRVSDEVLENLI